MQASLMLASVASVQQLRTGNRNKYSKSFSMDLLAVTTYQQKKNRL